MLTPLPRPLVENHVLLALEEDLGQAGDLTTQAVVPSSLEARVQLVARETGCVAGLDVARAAFRLVDQSLLIAVLVNDGEKVAAGAAIAVIEGPAGSILTAERVALNFLGHLSGVASVTAQMVEATKGTRAKICCTRKTTPGLRAMEKYAVRAGGGSNHRFGLGDAILIKDNHIAFAGGVTEALSAAIERSGHMTSIEIEVDTLDQFEEALQAGARLVLLDNMSPDLLREAVSLNKGRAILEASGKVTPETVGSIAQTGVDYISCGWITHSAPTLDIGLDFEQVL